jgi:hypothetical protein
MLPVLYFYGPYITVSAMGKPTNFVTFRVNDLEKEILRNYCEKLGRTQTDVLRELIRNLQKENITLG